MKSIKPHNSFKTPATIVVATIITRTIITPLG